MNFTHKKRAAQAAVLMAGILLSACGAPSEIPNADGTSPEPQPSTFYCYNTTEEQWQEETGATAGTRIYVDAATDAVIADLMEQRSYTREDAEDLLNEGGLAIYLCMDADLQNMVDMACAEQGKQAHSSESGQPMQSAVVLLENTTGKVLALSGEELDGEMPNPATQALYIPGSALLPLSVYAPALELGKLTSDSVWRDRPNELGWPVNPSGTYQDSVTVVEALRTVSFCVPVAILEKSLTLEDSMQFLQDAFSIELVRERTEGSRTVTDVSPVALALGGLTDGVSPLALAGAFSVFPRGGEYAAPTLYTRVVDRDGKEMLSTTMATTRVFTTNTASTMTDMLREVVANGAGAEAKLDGQNAAGLPGVTPAGKDLWFVGYTPDYTAAVWSGYGSREVLSVPGNPSAVLWKQVMQGASEQNT